MDQKAALGLKAALVQKRAVVRHWLRHCLSSRPRHTQLHMRIVQRMGGDQHGCAARLVPLVLVVWECLLHILHCWLLRSTRFCVIPTSSGQQERGEMEAEGREGHILSERETELET